MPTVSKRTEAVVAATFCLRGRATYYAYGSLATQTCPLTLFSISGLEQIYCAVKFERQREIKRTVAVMR
jgi:hypothetical protein